MDKALDKKFETEEQNTVSMTHMPSPKFKEEHRNKKRKSHILKKLKIQMKSRKFLTDGEASDSQLIRQMHTESDDQSRRMQRRISIDKLFSYMRVVKYPSRSSQMKNPFKKGQQAIWGEEEIMGKIEQNNISRFQESDSLQQI